MPFMPADAAPYKKTRHFTVDDVPDALLKRHNTKAGTWGKIIVERGCLRYTIFDDRGEGQHHMLRAGESPGIIEPQVLFAPADSA